jgi:hypothetical protein
MKKTIIFSLIPVFILLVILEVVGRIIYPLDQDKRAAVIAERDPRTELSYFDPDVMREYHAARRSYITFLGWIGAPGTDLPSIKTDAHGFRGRPVEPRRDNEYRILIVGGSSAWGLGASSNQTTPAGYLEQMLNETGQDTVFRVMNGAFPAWESREEMIVTIEFFDYFDPDMIIAFTGFNDITGLTKMGERFFALREESAVLAKAVEEQIRPMGTMTALRKLAGSLGLWRLVVYFRELRALEARKQDTVKGHYAYDENVSREGFKRIVRRYRIMASFGDRSHAKLVIALQPDIFSTKKPMIAEEASIVKHHRARFRGIQEAFLRYRTDMLTALKGLGPPKPTIVDLAPVFDKVAEPIFIDPAHYIDKGNLHVAARLKEVVLDAMEDRPNR